MSHFHPKNIAESLSNELVQRLGQDWIPACYEHFLGKYVPAIKHIKGHREIRIQMSSPVMYYAFAVVNGNGETCLVAGHSDPFQALADVDSLVSENGLAHVEPINKDD